MIVIKVKPGTKEWLELRRSKIGASDSPVIMGVSPFKTEYSLFLEKTCGIDQEKTMAMTRGEIMEERARDAFEKMTGLMVDPLVVQSNSYDWQMASLDGMDYERTTIVELKCPNKRTHEKAKNGIVPEEYFPQLQHQLAVTGLEKGFYFSFDGQDGALVEVTRDDNYISDMIKKEEIFYKRMVEFDPPKPSEKDYVEIFEEEYVKMADRLKEIDVLSKELDGEKEKLKENLIAISRGTNLKLGKIKLTQIVSEGRVDYKTIPQLQNVDLSQYRKSPTKYWRLSIV